MIVCQWHLDIPYGRQVDALAVMRVWGAEKFASSEFRRARGARLLCGLLGTSASHIVHEFVVEALAPFIIPGSQHWEVFRVLDERPRG